VTNPTVLWPCVDVGGTSIRVLLVADRGDQRPTAVVRRDLSTPRGLEALLASLWRVLEDASTTAHQRGYEIAEALAIGTPGRLQPAPGGRRTIAPSSATNLEAVPGELDGVDLAGELARALELSSDRVFWDNDAVLQGRYLIGELLRDPASAPRLEGRVVVCINPGTGLGGCVAEVGEDRSVEIFTDSHVSELLLHPIDIRRPLGSLHATTRSTPDASAVKIEVRRHGQVRRERLVSPNGKQAEDFISGTGLVAFAVALERTARQLDPPMSCFDLVPEAIGGETLSGLLERGGDGVAARAAALVGDLGGLALARLLQALHDGSAEKAPSFPDWSPSDLHRLRGVSRFVFGGGITGTALGHRMITGARQRLSEWSDLQLFQMNDVADDAGALGAFSLIPDSLRHPSAAS
jgi:hypothetical protein